MNIREWFDKLYELRKMYGDNLEVEIFCSDGCVKPHFYYNVMLNKILIVDYPTDDITQG